LKEKKIEIAHKSAKTNLQQGT